MDVIIIVDGPPVPKGRPRITAIDGRARAYTPAKTRSYEGQIAAEAARVMGRKPAIADPVSCSILAYVPVPKSYSKRLRADCLNGNVCPAKKPDLDNYIKVALDGIKSIVLKDDNQVCIIDAGKYYSDDPRLEIQVTTL